MLGGHKVVCIEPCCYDPSQSYKLALKKCELLLGSFLALSLKPHEKYSTLRLSFATQLQLNGTLKEVTLQTL